MLCPEVWNFKSPSDLVSVYSGNTSDLKHCENLIKNHYFNHNVSVVLPNCPKIPEYLFNELKDDCDYYKVNLPVSQLIEKEFIELFVNAGELSALSVGTRIDIDECACVAPNGVLVLSVAREIYQKLGIEGTPWGNLSSSSNRYAVFIDLKKECFKPGKPNYNKIYKSFTSLVPLQFDFIISWEPPADKVNICPSSIASYLYNKGHDVRLCKPSCSYKIERNVMVPLIRATEPDELLEWLGAFSLGLIKRDNSLSSLSLEYISPYTPPSECEIVSQVVMFQWTGFFTNRKISQLFTKLWNYGASEGISMPWLSLNVIGFSDSPVSWQMKLHSYFTSGNNHFTIFVHPDKYLLTFKVTPGNLKSVKNNKNWIYCDHLNKIKVDEA
ncbi:ribonuclease P protein subunit p40-like isoform X2 [Lycorma delicatula]|uniref:ribonuclease P protein subunit p40-like isoform X2 n=1 Tax=Lycorma delicatula TaxID=130591 RepID=UPI003F519D32